MKILSFDNEQDWLDSRVGKFTGSKLGGIIKKRKSDGQKIGYYELIAERIALPSDGENPMDRGKRLEEEAIEQFEKETGKVIDKSLVLWTRDDDEDIAVSPDGFTEDLTEAVEIKCLNSAKHIQAFFEKVPSEFTEQIYQYFIVNDKLTTLYFGFYDPRLQAKQFFYFTYTREELKDKIDEYLQFERQTLKDINEIVKSLLAGTKLEF